MNNNVKAAIILLVSLVLMTAGIVFFNRISEKKDDKVDISDIDLSDVNNVPIIDAKLGDDIRITQSYLKTYALKKSSTWYKSKATIVDIKKSNNLYIYTLSDSINNIKAYINEEKAIYKKGDLVYFVGTIDLNTYEMNLAKVSYDDIDYSSAIDLEFNLLYENFNTLKNNYFVVTGYMVTDNEKYKLYESKDKYLEDSSAGNYFLLSWDGKFNYTGNQDVKIRCQLEGTYKLKMCTLEN